MTWNQKRVGFNLLSRFDLSVIFQNCEGLLGQKYFLKNKFSQRTRVQVHSWVYCSSNNNNLYLYVSNLQVICLKSRLSSSSRMGCICVWVKKGRKIFLGVPTLSVLSPLVTPPSPSLPCTLFELSQGAMCVLRSSAFRGVRGYLSTRAFHMKIQYYWWFWWVCFNVVQWTIKFTLRKKPTIPLSIGLKAGGGWILSCGKGELLWANFHYLLNL